MNTKKSNQLNWRNKRTVETADPNAKVVLSDDTFVDFSELSTDPEVDEVKRSVSAIEAKIPTEASSQNQLADKDFVNEGIATASADFKGTYNSLQELEQVEANANDYGFVIVEDQYGNTRYDRYKYTEGDGWLYEYSVNSVQFSNTQWNAINSGITSDKREGYDNHVSNNDIHVTTSDKSTWSAKYDKPSGGIPKTDLADAVQTSLGKADTALQAHQDISGKADKSEMAVTQGTGADADKTTIQLKSGTSATVLNTHQQLKTINNESITGSGNITIVTDISGKADKVDVGDKANLTTTNKSTLVAAINEVNTKALTIGEVETFSTSENYQIGDYVIYNNKLYKFTSAHSAGAWVGTDADETTIVEELEEFTASADGLTNKVRNFEGALAGNTQIEEFSESTTYGTGVSQVHYCYRNNLLYAAIATHTGAWNAEHFEAINTIDLLETYKNMVVGDKTVNEFDPEKEYTVGDPVIYNNKFYIFKRGHTGAWDDTDVDESSFVEWLQGLSDTIETYVGNGKEQVVVSCTTEAQGVSTTGLTLMVYLNGSTTEAEEYTTDSHGMATFRVPVGYTYRIVYPTVAGVITPAPETHTASVGQRSVEVRYEVPPPAQVETLVVSFQKWGENSSYTPYQGQATITIGGTATTYTAGADGNLTVEIPIGTSYTLDIIKPEGLHIMGGSYHKSLVAEQSSRVEVVRLSEYLSGILLTDAEGNDYSFGQFQSLVEQGVLAKGDAKYIHLCTNALLTHSVAEGTDSTCYVSIYEIGKRKYHDTDNNFAGLQWCNSDVQFSSIPNDVYQYDGKYRTAQIVAEGIERSLTTPAATRLSGMSYTFTNSDATVITGFLASRGQWDALWNNRVYIDEMLDYVFDEEEYYTVSSLTVYKWSSDQGMRISAWYLTTSWSQNLSNNPVKRSDYTVVPFYA